jgi:hypothetical protein
MYYFARIQTVRKIVKGKPVKESHENISQNCLKPYSLIENAKKRKTSETPVDHLRCIYLTLDTAVRNIRKESMNIL